MNPHCASFILIFYYKQNIHSESQKFLWDGSGVHSPLCLCILSSDESVFLHSYLPFYNRALSLAPEEDSIKGKQEGFWLYNVCRNLRHYKRIRFIIFAENVCILPILYSTPLN